jgi:type IV secretion system protein VirB10
MSTSTASAPAQPDIRPEVAFGGSNRPLWVALVSIGILGVLLFAILESRRQKLAAPRTRAPVSEMPLASQSSTPPLYVPLDLARGDTLLPSGQIAPSPIALAEISDAIAVARPVPVPARSPPLPVSVVTVRPSPAFTPPPNDIRPVPPSAVIIYDNGSYAGSGSGGSALATATAATSPRRSSPDNGLLLRQGSLIEAVLETAIDSTQPGFVRAMVSRDFRGARGQFILVPRGSRLFGEYKGDATSGQRRVLVQWTRLVRPDGVTIMIDGPAVDPLGRSGITGRARSRFLAQFGSALLQTAVQAGALIGTRAIGDSAVLVGLPGTQASGTGQGASEKVTLTVRQGTRVAAIAPRDIDFSSVGE